MPWAIGNYWNFGAILFGVPTPYWALVFSGRKVLSLHSWWLRPNGRSRVSLLRAQRSSDNPTPQAGGPQSWPGVGDMRPLPGPWEGPVVSSRPSCLLQCTLHSKFPLPGSLLPWIPSFSSSFQTLHAFIVRFFLSPSTLIPSLVLVSNSQLKVFFFTMLFPSSLSPSFSLFSSYPSPCHYYNLLPTFLPPLPLSNLCKDLLQAMFWVWESKKKRWIEKLVLGSYDPRMLKWNSSFCLFFCLVNLKNKTKPNTKNGWVGFHRIGRVRAWWWPDLRHWPLAFRKSLWRMAGWVLTEEREPFSGVMAAGLSCTALCPVLLWAAAGVSFES